MVDIDLSGRFAAVTGGARGIGHAIVRALAEAGAAVAVLDKDADAAEETASSLRRGGGDARALALDVTDRVQVDAVVDALWTQRPIDIWVNNAGVSSMGRLVDLTDEDWDFNMDVNAKGVFLCSRAVARKMLFRERGTIVNVASMAALRGVPLLSHYAASKWAVVGFTKSIAQELAPHITVNAVCPGYVATDMQSRELVWEGRLRGMTPEDVRKDYVDHTPLARIETPEDVAEAVRYLASDRAAFLTGVALPVTGGADLL